MIIPPLSDMFRRTIRSSVALCTALSAVALPVVIITHLYSSPFEEVYAAVAEAVVKSALQSSYPEKEETGKFTVNLQSVHAGSVLPFLRDAEIKGVMSINTDIFRGSGDMAGKLMIDSEITISGFFLSSRRFQVNLLNKNVRLTLKGTYDFREDLADIAELEIRLPGLKPWTVRGTVSSVLSGDPDMSLFADGPVPLRMIKEDLSGAGVEFLEYIDYEASGSASLAIQGTLSSPKIKGNVLIESEWLSGNKMNLSSCAINLQVSYQKDRIIIRNANIRVGKWVYTDSSDPGDVVYGIDNAEIQVPLLEIRGPRVTSDMISMTADRASLSGSERVILEEKSIALTLRMESDLDRHKVKLRDFSLQSDLIRNMTAVIDMSYGAPIRADVTLEYAGFDVDKLSRRLPSSVLRERGFSIHGTGSVHAAMQLSSSESGNILISASADGVLGDAGFTNSGGTVIAEGISASASARFQFSLPLENIDFRVNADSTGFELLAGKFYGSFIDRDLSFSAEGTYDSRGDHLTVAGSEINLTDTGRLAAAGNISGVTGSPSFDVRVDLAELSNMTAYNLFVRETFQEQYPYLGELDIKGESAASLSLSGSIEQFTARGDIHLSDTYIRGKSEDRFIRNLNLSLPVNISYPEAGRGGEKIRYGFMKVDDVSWAFLTFRDIEVFPALWENSILFKEDISLPLMGGSVAIRDITYRDVLSPGRKLHLAAEIKNIDLAEASDALDMPVFSGTLSGRIPSATLTGNRLITEGAIVLELFDGKMVIRELSMNRVTSPIRSLKLSVDVQDIDLGKVTSVFDFGHISGVIRGSVRDLVIVKGQAQSFSASLESVKKKGISQKIGVQALKKISILGSGTSVSVLDRGIYQLFKEYRYKKLGFRASLKNDNLLLLGVESQGNIQYLVKGGLLPPKVNVLNYHQNISFQEMVRRLKRIGNIEQ